MTPAVLLVAIAVALLLSAFFSGSETALLRLKPEEVENDIKKHPRPSEVAARELIKSSSRLLVTILVGNNLANIFAASAASAVAVIYFGDQAGLAIATGAMTILITLFSEIIPKALGANNPRKIGYLVSLPLYLLHKLLWPIHILFDKLIDPMIVKLVGHQQHQDIGSAESLLRLAKEVRRSKSDGSPIPIIGSAAKAAELTVSDIMIPRAEITAYTIEMPAEQLLEAMLADRFTRVPVYEGSLDKVLGLVHFKDVVALAQSGETDVRGIVKPLLRVPERMPILMLLADMQKAFSQMAIVKDEFGLTQGIVTQEDILEEIVGEIRDEFDGEELMSILKISEDTYDVLGRVLVHDFNRETGWEVKAQRGDTLSGLVFNGLGRTPKKGDSIEIGAYSVTVSDVSGSRIIRVRISKRVSRPAATSAAAMG